MGRPGNNSEALRKIRDDIVMKLHVDIGQSHNTFKNTKHDDRTYTRAVMAFVNFISLMTHYGIHNLLIKHDLVRKNSPEYAIEALQRVNILKISEEWKMSRIPKKTRNTIEAFEIPIMRKKGVIG